MRFIWVALAICAASAASAQIIPESKRPTRIPVRHADPWMIKALLEGQRVQFPEISTILGVVGMGGAAGAVGNQLQNAGNALFTGGKLIVNPTDNSLWFFPD